MHRVTDKELSRKGMDTLFNGCTLRTLRNVICCKRQSIQTHDTRWIRQEKNTTLELC
jgi:hypothetical protein